MKKFLLPPLFLLFFAGMTLGFLPSSEVTLPREALAARQQSYQAYVSNQPSLWLSAMSTLRNLSQAKRHQDPELLYEWSLAEYAYVGYCIGTESIAPGFDDRIITLQERLEGLLDLRKNDPKVEAMLGAVLAMRIGRSPARGIYLGPRSSSYIEDAMQHGPQSPEAWVEQGNMRFHAPALFGGDMDQAIVCFRRAAALFASQPDRAHHNWLHLHALAWLGKSYEAKSQWSDARRAYEQALTVEPEFSWVKSELLPGIKQRQE